MNESIKSILSDEIISEIETAEQQNKDNPEAIYSLYIHIVPKEISGYDWDKYYVGITKRNVLDRWRNGKGYNTQVLMARAINRYGWENLKHIVVSNTLLKEQAFEFEKSCIGHFNSDDFNYGYNLSSGGESGACGLIGEKNPNYGKPRPKEVIEKMRKTKLEKHVSPSQHQRELISQRLKQCWNDPEYRSKMSGENAPCYGRTGDKHPLYVKTGSKSKVSKKVICLDTLEVYPSASTVTKLKKYNHSKLCMCCRGERKSCGKDDEGNPLHWQYYDLYLQENNLTDEEAQKSLFFILDEI